MKETVSWKEAVSNLPAKQWRQLVLVTVTASSSKAKRML